MIAAGLDWGNDARFDLSRLCVSLGLLAGGPADSEDVGHGVLCSLRAPRAAPQRGWTAARTPDDHPLVLSGWIDNADSIAAELGLPAKTDPATLYGAAFARWGDGAERRLTGDYAAIIMLGPGTLRLSRGAWSVQPLFWASDGTVALVSSIPRPIFAAGFPKVPDPDRYAEALHSLATLCGDTHFFRGLYRVPTGAVVMLDHGRASTNRWYDPHELAPTRLSRDEDYVEAARGLLGEAVAAAIGPAQDPGILLSGGLDSPLIAAEMLRRMPDGKRLKSFTFVPAQDSEGIDAPGFFPSDRPAVEAFAAMHPRLDTHFVVNQRTNLGHRLEEFFLAADAAYPAMAVNEYHGPWQAAADAGCDWVFTGEWGNQTFSNDGRWAFVEFLRSGKWLELWRMLRDVPDDDRSMLRRLAARSILPNLPATWRSALRTLVHGPPHASLIRREVAERLQLDERRNALMGDREWTRSRRQFIELFWLQANSAGEMTHAVEQIHGIRLRAVPRYRPLIEFCLTIPTGQFVRNGRMRWLARRMAAGRMPERQRMEMRYGLHGTDWHQRNTPMVPAMREELERIADDPVMARIIDVDRAIDLLDRWPEGPSARAMLDIYMPVAAAIIAGRFARYVDGRN